VVERHKQAKTSIEKQQKKKKQKRNLETAVERKTSEATGELQQH
jgi:hypothetical protein